MVKILKPKFNIVVSGAADLRACCPKIKALSLMVGREVIRQGCNLLTGATTGAPYYAARGAKEVGGFSIGFSPASSEKEHIRKYKLPTDAFDLIIYTGFDYVGRNLMLTKAGDGVIIVCGRTGTLNEFTIAFESATPIGVLRGTGGTADLIDEILSRGYRPKTKIVFDADPGQLVGRLIKVIKLNKKVGK